MRPEGGTHEQRVERPFEETSKALRWAALQRRAPGGGLRAHSRDVLSSQMLKVK